MNAAALTPKQKVELAEELAEVVVRVLMVEEGDWDGLNDDFHERLDTAQVALREAASREKARWEERDYKAECRDCAAAFATSHVPESGTHQCPVCGGTMDVMEGDVEPPDVFSDIRTPGREE